MLTQQIMPASISTVDNEMYYFGSSEAWHHVCVGSIRTPQVQEWRGEVEWGESFTWKKAQLQVGQKLQNIAPQCRDEGGGNRNRQEQETEEAKQKTHCDTEGRQLCATPRYRQVKAWDGLPTQCLGDAAQMDQCKSGVTLLGPFYCNALCESNRFYAL